MKFAIAIKLTPALVVALASPSLNAQTYAAQTNAAVVPPELNTNRVPPGFKTPHLLIRSDWTQVLVGEDPSQSTGSGSTNLGNIHGATVSYTRNGIKSSEGWTAVGSLIGVFPYVNAPSLAWPLDMAAFAPSVSIDKVYDSAKPTNDVDHLDFRLGAYGRFVGFDKALGAGGALLGRVALVYGTDTRLRAALPAVEMDIEPEMFISGVPDFSIGYKNTLLQNPKDPGAATMDYQVRSWVHLEGGNLQQNGTNWDTVNGSFLRVGPSVQGQFNFKLPQGWANTFLIQSLSLSGEYDYLPSINGPTGQNYLYKLSGALNFFKSAKGQKIALTADYTKGGLTLSKQPVDTLTVGLGLLF